MQQDPFKKVERISLASHNDSDSTVQSPQTRRPQGPGIDSASEGLGDSILNFSDRAGRYISEQTEPVVDEVGNELQQAPALFAILIAMLVLLIANLGVSSRAAFRRYPRCGCERRP